MEIRVYNNKFSFQSGLTKQMKAEIRHCNVKDIENYFAAANINTDFKNNRVVAWSSLKCFQILRYINNRFHYNTGMPNGILVEDYEKLNGVDQSAMGLTNFVPSYLFKAKDIIVPEKTIVFNSNNIKWENLDSIADECYEKGISATDFFLENILHEFMHVLHENNMINRLGGEKLLKVLQSLHKEGFLDGFISKHGKKLSKICHYAGSNPLEAVACDLSKRNLKVLDKERLIPQKNIFGEYPYSEKTVLSHRELSQRDMLLRKLWNGKFSP